VSRLGQPLVVANTTVPPPYDFFLRKLFTDIMRHLNTTAVDPVAGRLTSPVWYFRYSAWLWQISSTVHVHGCVGTNRLVAFFPSPEPY